MRQTEAVLLADGIEPRWTASLEADAVHLDIAVSDGEHVTSLLSEQLAEDLRRLEARLPALQGSIWLTPPFATAFGLAAVLLAFFGLTGPFDMSTLWFRHGALIANAAWSGEWWRLITAATLHADAGHAIGNAAFMVILGWGVAERVGGGVMMLLALLTAGAGFLVSMGLSDSAITVGASGGLFGLLGVTGGHGMRSPPQGWERKRHIMRTLGSAVMLLAFTAFSPEANIHAHVGGFVAGVLLGSAVPQRPVAVPIQIAASVAVVASIGGAWALSL